MNAYELSQPPTYFLIKVPRGGESQELLHIQIPPEWPEVAKQIAALPLLIDALTKAWLAIDALSFPATEATGPDASSSVNVETARAMRTIHDALVAAGVALK